MLNDDQIATLCATSQPKLDAMRAAMKARGSALIAFSGGVDSAFVLKIAVEQLGDRAIALTAISPSVAQDEADEAAELAKTLGAKHVRIDSHELEDPRYAANPTNRCYFCKTELYTLCETQRVKLGLGVVLDGFNADDKKDHRPGHQAARERAVASPLADAGLTKDEIRAWSKRLGLPTWDKPQMACLASRLPYGTQVTVERLNQVGRAEKALRGLGLKTFRVRHHDTLARLEVAAEEQPLFHDGAFTKSVDQALKACGYAFVAIDLEPFRSGRLNDVLRKPEGLALSVLPA